MPKIFISYRRADSNEESRLIYDALVDHFGEDNIFRDKDRIPKGVDFRTTIERYIFQSDEMLVLIGQKWLDIREDNNPKSRRLDNSKDFVRIEIELGLRHANVTPVILQNADLPTEEELPRSLTQLSFQNAYFLSPDNFDDDLRKLVEDIANRYSIKATTSIPDADSSASIDKKSNIPNSQDANKLELEVSSIKSTPWWKKPEFVIGAILVPIIAAVLGAVIQIMGNNYQPQLTPSVSDIQLTAQAEVFATETSAVKTQAVIAQQTHNAVLTEQFVENSSATSIAQLALTPSATDTPSLTATLTETHTLTPTLTPTDTPTPTVTATTIPDWFKRCQAYPSGERSGTPAQINGVIANGEWDEWVGLSGDAMTSCAKLSTHTDFDHTVVAVIVCDDEWQLPPVTVSSQTVHEYDPTTAGFDLLQIQIAEADAFLVAKNMVSSNLPSGISIKNSHPNTECLIVELSTNSMTTAIEITFFDFDSSDEFTKLYFSYP